MSEQNEQLDREINKSLSLLVGFGRLYADISKSQFMKLLSHYFGASENADTLVDQYVAETFGCNLADLDNNKLHTITEDFAEHLSLYPSNDLLNRINTYQEIFGRYINGQDISTDASKFEHLFNHFDHNSEVDDPLAQKVEPVVFNYQRNARLRPERGMQMENSILRARA